MARDSGLAVPAVPDPVPPLGARQLRMYRGGFWLFIVAEALGFLTLFSLRFLLAGTGRPGELNGVLGGLVTLAFAASLVPAVGGLRAIRAGDRQGMISRLGIALGLGNGTFQIPPALAPGLAPVNS